MKKFEIYSSAFKKKAIDSGYSQEEIQKCLKYAKPLIENDLPIIYNPSHLAALVGYNKNYLKRVVKTNSTQHFYRNYKIRKKNGGSRTINEPLPSLKEIQTWLLSNIFIKIQTSEYAKAYTKNKSIKDHVKYHKKAKAVLTLDIKDFFPSLTVDKIELLLIELGYSKLISNLISKLCTLDGKLAQGAPTSPTISNILLFNFDINISKFISEFENKIKYTRYADDLAFSGDFEVDTIITFVKKELDKLGLDLNENKINYMSTKQRQIISGIVVNEKIQLPRKKRDNLRQAVYYIEKFGLENHLEKINCEKSNYVKHLLGYINYGLKLNPKDHQLISLKKTLYNYI